MTSRELLRVQGEVEYAVPPLSEPEAVSLFCARSQLEADETINELCRRLDDLPLAVELAAARTRALSPQQILDRLSQRLDLLKGGRDADARQQTLRATIEWSYDLLSEPEQQLFARISVFAGGCTLDAAEEVAEADHDTLQSLVEKSILRFTDGRYWMLETIREYAHERLAKAGEVDATFERLARHLLALAEAEGAPHFRDRQTAAFARLELEHANTRAVMDRALQQGRYELAAEIAGLLRDVWIVRGHLDEATGWINAVLQGRGAVAGPLWTEVLIAASDVMKLGNDLGRATEVAEELVELATDDPNVDQLYVAAALADLSDIARLQGDLARSREYAERSLAFRASRGLPGGRASTSLGEIALEEGDLERAARYFEAASRDSARLGHDLNYVAALKSLGEVARRRGDSARAIEQFTEALHRSMELGDQGAVGDCLLDLALVAHDRGQVEKAAKLWGAGQAVREAFGVWDAAFGRRRVEPDLPADAKAAGAAMDLAEAVAYALDSID